MLPGGHFAQGAPCAFLANLALIYRIRHYRATFRLEIRQLRTALRKSGSGAFHLILTLAVILAAFSLITGAEAAEHEQSTGPLPSSSEQAQSVESDVRTREEDSRIEEEEDTGMNGEVRAQDNAPAGSILSIGGPIRGLSSSLNISVDEEYNDNIYQDANAGASDFITRIKLAINSSLTGALGNVKLSYQPQQLIFSRNPGNNELSHEFHASVSTDHDQGLTLIRNLIFLDLSDAITREHYTTRQEAREGEAQGSKARKDDNLFVSRTTKNELRIHPYIKKRLHRTSSLELGYEYTNTAYGGDSQATDRESYGGAVVLSRAFSRRLEGNIGYRLSKEIASSSEFNDYVRREAGLGLSRQLGRSLKLTGTGGYNWLTFTSGTRNAGTFWSINLDGALPSMRASALSYSYADSCQNSIDSGAVRLRRHSLEGNYQRRTQIAWAMFTQKEYYQERDWTDESRGIDASLAIPLYKKTDLTLSAGWIASDFEPEDEQVRSRSAGIGILWKILPPFRCAVGCRYSRNASTVEANDYRNTVAYIRAGMELY